MTYQFLLWSQVLVLTFSSCLSVCTLGSYCMSIRYSVHCRWDPFHRIPKRMLMISRVSSSLLGCYILRSFLYHLSLQAYLLTCLCISARTFSFTGKIQRIAACTHNQHSIQNSKQLATLPYAFLKKITSI